MVADAVACPACRTQLAYDAQYGMWRCASCGNYFGGGPAGQRVAPAQPAPQQVSVPQVVAVQLPPVPVPTLFSLRVMRTFPKIDAHRLERGNGLFFTGEGAYDVTSMANPTAAAATAAFAASLVFRPHNFSTTMTEMENKKWWKTVKNWTIHQLAAAYRIEHYYPFNGIAWVGLKDVFGGYNIVFATVHGQYFQYASGRSAGNPPMEEAFAALYRILGAKAVRADGFEVPDRNIVPPPVQVYLPAQQPAQGKSAQPAAPPAAPPQAPPPPPAPQRSPPEPGGESRLDDLDERLIIGEISEAEYQRLKAELRAGR